jgi:hypothetical protein
VNMRKRGAGPEQPSRRAGNAAKSQGEPAALSGDENFRPGPGGEAKRSRDKRSGGGDDDKNQRRMPQSDNSRRRVGDRREGKGGPGFPPFPPTPATKTR